MNRTSQIKIATANKSADDTGATVVVAADATVLDVQEVIFSDFKALVPAKCAAPEQISLMFKASSLRMSDTLLQADVTEGARVVIGEKLRSKRPVVCHETFAQPAAVKRKRPAKAAGTQPDAGVNSQELKEGSSPGPEASTSSQESDKGKGRKSADDDSESRPRPAIGERIIFTEDAERKLEFWPDLTILLGKHVSFVCQTILWERTRIDQILAANLPMNIGTFVNLRQAVADCTGNITRDYAHDTIRQLQELLGFTDEALDTLPLVQQVRANIPDEDWTGSHAKDLIDPDGSALSAEELESVGVYQRVTAVELEREWTVFHAKLEEYGFEGRTTPTVGSWGNRQPWSHRCLAFAARGSGNGYLAPNTMRSVRFPVQSDLVNNVDWPWAPTESHPEAETLKHAQAIFEKLRAEEHGRFCDDASTTAVPLLEDIQLDMMALLVCAQIEQHEQFKQQLLATVQGGKWPIYINDHKIWGAPKP